MIRNVVILAGTAGRLATVRSALGRNLFDLPAADGRPLLAGWLERFNAMLEPRAAQMKIWLAVDGQAPKPMPASIPAGQEVELVRDGEATRGTAGILRDLTRFAADDDDLFVLQASDLAWEWSAQEAEELFSDPSDIVISADRDLRPAGLLRVKCELLKRIPSVGFVDLKEQFLPRCAGTARIRVLRSDRARCGSLHSLGAYLDLALPRGARVPEDFISAGSAVRATLVTQAQIEPGAKVDARATIFNSVLLAGARVERDAVVIRSLVGSGVVVRAGTQLVDGVVVNEGGGAHREVAW